MSAWVESQITTSTPVQQNRNHLCAQIKSTWPLGIFLTFFELYGISVFAPSQFFWQLSLSGVRELSRWPLWYTEGEGKFDMKVVPCPKMSYMEVKKSYMEVKKSDMEVAPFSLIKALSTFLHRPYFHLFLTQLRYGQRLTFRFRNFSVSKLLPNLWGFRFRKIWFRKKSLGFGFEKIWSRKKVSVSVSENLVSEKKSQYRFRSKFWYRHSVPHRREDIYGYDQ